MKMDIDDNELLDFSRSDLIYRFLVEEYGWTDVQQSLFQALMEDRPEKDYAAIAEVFWNAILDGLDSFPFRGIRMLKEDIVIRTH